MKLRAILVSLLLRVVAAPASVEADVPTADRLAGEWRGWMTTTLPGGTVEDDLAIELRPDGVAIVAIRYDERETLRWALAEDPPALLFSRRARPGEEAPPLVTMRFTITGNSMDGYVTPSKKISHGIPVTRVHLARVLWPPLLGINRDQLVGRWAGALSFFHSNGQPAFETPFEVDLRPNGDVGGRAKVWTFEPAKGRIAIRDATNNKVEISLTHVVISKDELRARVTTPVTASRGGIKAHLKRSPAPRKGLNEKDK